MARFVILRHETPAGYPRATHFDLMLERGHVLRTWALDSLPLADQAFSAEQLADHRLAYLDFEGPLSEGRGSVARIDSGTYELLGESPREVVLRLAGEKFKGTLTLAADADLQRWRVLFSPG